MRKTTKAKPRVGRRQANRQSPSASFWSSSAACWKFPISVRRVRCCAGRSHLHADRRRQLARPPDGDAARLAHEQFVDPAFGRLIDDLAPYAESLPPDADDASLIRVVRRDFDKAIKVPADYVARANAHGSASYNAWTRARPANDVATMIPYLEKTLELSANTRASSGAATTSPIP